MMGKTERKNRLFTYVPPLAFGLLCFTLLAALAHLVARLSPAAADWLNRVPSGAFRFLLAKVSGVLPFSLAETVLLALPFVLVLLFLFAWRAAAGKVSFWRYLTALLSVLGLLYSLFVFTIGCGYFAPSLDRKLGLARADVSAAELYDTALILRAETATLADTFARADGASVMPYSLSVMNEKLLSAYDAVCDTYGFIQHMDTNLKPVMMSEAMSYTHITGVYTYMTGEANLNVDFPDYTLPFTAAHELAHQRGIARENEANFVAFLVCIASDDPYVQYSGYFNMLEYVTNALYRADPDLYVQLTKGYSVGMIKETQAYWNFFEKYEDSVIGEVSGSINDAYLQWQGTPGTKSYGMVVDLAVAYYKNK